MKKLIQIISVCFFSVLVNSAPILKTITIDGNMSDWQDIILNPGQYSDDDQGGSWPSSDRDYPVQSTGRDLKKFAYTWDATYLFLYTERYGSSTNVQDWWYYLDGNNDGRLQSNEYVLRIRWNGSNRLTEHRLNSYNPVDPAGDPLVDADGYADGYTMPGTVTEVSFLEELYGGSEAGLEMECRISWQTLGVPAGSPIKFHISTSNGPNIPQQIDDNMGGPGGGAGSNEYADLLWIANKDLYLNDKNKPANFYQILCNLGNISDTFDFSYTWTGDFQPDSVSYYEDTNHNGSLDLTDPLLSDSDSDGNIDSSLLQSRECIETIISVMVPLSALDGQYSQLNVYATSSFNQSVFKFVVDRVTLDLLSQDSDGDGLMDDEELNIGSDPQDTDSDDDGVPDGSEINWDEDLDGDGLPAVLDPDSDNDGVLDGTEMSITNPGSGTDISAGNFVADVDPQSATDPSDPDTDNDNADDGCEDTNKNGNVDSGESDPLNISSPNSCQDTDGDGLTDAEEINFGTNPNDADSDDDGVPDGEEPNWNLDTDGDGTINALDPDSDNDGIYDGTEMGYTTPNPDTNTSAGYWVPDSDPTTTTSPVDSDSDNDGLTDGQEDANHNGGINTNETDPNDPDTDNDNILDSDDGLSDADGDGTINGLDLDSDGDGIPDIQEAGDTNLNTLPVDTDQDTIPDFLDPDSDGDGILDLVEEGSDFDSDGTSNYLDLDSDADGIADETEGTGDDDNDGAMNFLDPNETIPNLLRNDVTTSLSSYNPSQIFVNYPQDPSLDKFGPVPDGICHEGEGSLLYQNGSEDDDDFYAYHITSPYIDPDENVLNDNNRPLVFYQLDCQTCTIFLTKENGKIKITF